MRFFHHLHNNRNEVLCIAGVFVLALAFRLVLLKTQVALGWDESHYVRLGASMAGGSLARGLHAYWPPMYPIVIAIMSFFTSGFELAGRMTSVLSGVFILLPVYLLAKRVYGRRPALTSIFMLALYPPLTHFSTEAISEPLFMLFLLTAVYIGGVSLERPTIFRFISTSFFFGLAYLTKPEGMGYYAVYTAIMFIWGLVAFVREKRLTRWMLTIVGLVVFAGVSAFYLLYLHRVTGRWTFSSKVIVSEQFLANRYVDEDEQFMASHLNDDDTLLPIDAIYHDGTFLKLLEEKKHEPTPVPLSMVLRNFGIHFYRALKYMTPQMLGAILFFVMSIGLFTSDWTRQEAKINGYLMGFVVSFWFIIIPMFFLLNRYYFPGLVICFIWIGKGADEVLFKLEGGIRSMLRKVRPEDQPGRMRPAHIILRILVILAFTLIPEFGKIVLRQDADDFYGDAVEMKKAGLWLKDHSEETPVLMSLNKGVDFYAGNVDIRSGASIPMDPLPRVIRYARNRKVDFLVLMERYRERYPQLVFLLESTAFPSSLELVYEDMERKGYGIRIFRIVSSPAEAHE